MSRMLEYVEYLENTHRTLRAILINSGKTYRSHKVAFENGYLSALRDIEDAIKRPQKNAELEASMRVFAERFKV